jgi:hypothetical protein
MSREIHATMVEGQWLIQIKSDLGHPITPREFARFERALTLKTRLYYINERKVSVEAARKREVKAQSDAKTAEAVKVTSKLTPTV